MKKTKSLSFKLATFFVIAFLTAITAGVVTSYVVQDKIINDYTSSRLKNSVYESSKELDKQFVKIESTLEYIQLFSETKFSKKEDLGNKTTVNEQLPVIQAAFSTVTRNQTDISSYWIILNPTFTYLSPDAEEGDGFFYVRDEIGSFKPYNVTNVLKYKDTDKERIAWWTQVNQTYAPLWMEPYFNANINVNMYSYVRPFFSETKDFLGAVGIDLYYDNLITSISTVREYKDGHTMLFNENNKIIYHKDVQTFDGKKYVGTTKTLKDLTGVENFQDSENETITYRYLGRRRTTTSVELENHLSYAISVSTGELRQPVRFVIFIPLLVYLGISIAALIVVYLLTKKFLDPLRQLNEAAKKVGGGDLRVKLEVLHNDEIGQLTESFSKMVESIDSKNRLISAMAYIDGLTKVKNKNAQQEIEFRINKQIEKGTARFAVAMLDVNNLKKINDNEGHEAGDKAIVGSCYSLCKGFSHSPVYRMGGDEFIAIIEGEDYDKREEIYAKLVQNEIDVKNVKYDFSVGIATFDPKIDKSFKDVLNRADEEMYKVKKAKKNG